MLSEMLTCGLVVLLLVCQACWLRKWMAILLQFSFHPRQKCSNNHRCNLISATLFTFPPRLIRRSRQHTMSIKPNNITPWVTNWEKKEISRVQLFNIQPQYLHILGILKHCLTEDLHWIKLVRVHIFVNRTCWSIIFLACFLPPFSWREIRRGDCRLFTCPRSGP